MKYLFVVFLMISLISYSFEDEQVNDNNLNNDTSALGLIGNEKIPEKKEQNLNFIPQIEPKKPELPTQQVGNNTKLALPIPEIKNKIADFLKKMSIPNKKNKSILNNKKSESQLTDKKKKKPRKKKKAKKVKKKKKIGEEKLPIPEKKTVEQEKNLDSQTSDSEIKNQSTNNAIEENNPYRIEKTPTNIKKSEFIKKGDNFKNQIEITEKRVEEDEKKTVSKPKNLQNNMQNNIQNSMQNNLQNSTQNNLQNNVPNAIQNNLNNKNQFNMSNNLPNNMTNNLFNKMFNQFLLPFYDIEHIAKTDEDFTLKKQINFLYKNLYYKIPEDFSSQKYLILNLIGQGDLKVELVSENKKDLMKTLGTITISYSNKENIVPISTKNLKKYINKYLRFTMVNVIPSLKIEIKGEMKDYFDFEFGDSKRILTPLIKELNIMVKNPAKSIVDVKLENRLQFIVETSLENQVLNGDEYIDMFINRKESFPTRTDYDLYSIDNVGFGLIKTISPKNEFYCQEKDCVYHVSIKLSNVEFVNFFPTVFANKSEIKFKRNLHIIEELEAGEIITYKLTVPKVNANWSFKVTSEMNAVHFFVNPDFIPENLEHYDYRSLNEGSQEILITKKESEDFKFSYQTFYVTYKPAIKDQSVSFYFDVKKIELDAVHKIEEGKTISGVVSQGEELDFYLDLNTGSPETYKLDFLLNIASGEIDMFIKECPYSKENKCELSNREIKKKKENPHEKTSYLFLTTDLTKTGDNMKKLKMDFNCMGNDPMEIENRFLNKFEILIKCRFLIALRYRQSDNKFGVAYNLSFTGNTIVRKLMVKQSISLQISKNEMVYYRFKIPKNEHYKQLFLRLVSLSGSCQVFFSRNAKYPDYEENEKNIKIENGDMCSIHTNTYEERFDISDEHIRHLYMSIDGIDNCILDLYTDFSNLAGGKTIIEKLSIDNLVHRTIKENSFFKKDGNIVYKADFYFIFPDEGFDNEEFINISIDSEELGLEICVQKNYIDIDPSKNCDFSSTTEHIKILNESDIFRKGGEIAISIRKTLKEGEFSNLPIEFSIIVKTKFPYLSTINLLEGKTYIHKLETKEDIAYKLNLTHMKKKGLLLFTSHSSFIRATLSTDLNQVLEGKKDGNIITTLNNSNFGFGIENASEFKKKYCRKQKKCELFIMVDNTGDEIARFNITYNLDENPIKLRKGIQLFVPSNRKLYFIAQPEMTNSLSFNYMNELTNSVAYSQVVSHKNFLKKKSFKVNKLENSLTESNFQFKTDIEKEGEILYYSNNYNRIENPLILFLLVPKFHIIKERSNSFIIYDHKDKTRISLHSKIRKLEPYNQLESRVNKGDFTYFYITLDEAKDFTIILNTHSGNVDLFINRGLNNLPTVKSYWVKGENFKDKEIIVTKKMFKSTAEMIDTYTIGVFGKRDSRFSVMFLDNFDNIIRLHYQKLSNFEIKKGKMYYIDYFDVNEVFNSIFYSEKSDVEISVFHYDEKLGQRFLEQIKDESKIIQQFLYKKGSPPRKKIKVENKSNLKSHYIIRLQAVDCSTNINFAIYDSKKPLIVPLEKRFSFTQDADESQIFQVKLDSDYGEADIDVKLDFGEIEFFLSENENFTSQYSGTKMLGSSQKFSKFKDFKGKEKRNDIIIFRNIFIKVKSTKLSKFSIYLKPVDKFKELKEFETEIIYPSPEKDTYLYYVVEKKNVKKIHSLVFDLYHVKFYNQKPEILFISDNDIELDAETPFLPMPIVDYLIHDIESTRHIEIHAAITPGYFIIKLQKTSLKIPFKISVSLNNKKQIEVNGSYVNSIPRPGAGNQNDYIMYLPESGEFRLLVESCSNLDVLKGIFRSDKDDVEREISFSGNYVQNYPFILSDLTGKEDVNVTDGIDIKVKRGVVQGSGLFRFGVENFGSADKVIDPNLGYYLVSEFRPENKQLILKDYLDLYNSNKDDSFNHQFVQDNKKLEITTKIPKFKEQLLRDYPNIKKIKILFNFYLFVDDKFMKKFRKCGNGALKTVKPKPKHHTIEKIINADDIRKDDSFSFSFLKSEMRTFKNSEFLTVFSRLKIIFFENEEEKYDISLDQKFTDVPYFVLKVKNLSGNFNLFYYMKNLGNIKIVNLSYYGLLILFGCFILLIAFFIITRMKRRKKVEKEFNDTEKNKFTKIEMS